MQYAILCLLVVLFFLVGCGGASSGCDNVLSNEEYAAFSGAFSSHNFGLDHSIMYELAGIEVPKCISDLPKYLHSSTNPWFDSELGCGEACRGWPRTGWTCQRSLEFPPFGEDLMGASVLSDFQKKLNCVQIDVARIVASIKVEPPPRIKDQMEITFLSRVGFNRDKTQGLVYYETLFYYECWCQLEGARKGWLLLNKVNGAWVVVKHKETFIT